MRLRVASFTELSALNARLTVITDTPAWRAMSFMVVVLCFIVMYGPAAEALSSCDI